MKSLLLSFYACFAAAAVLAQPAKQIITTHSFSGQFTARESRNRPSPWSIAPMASRVPVAGGMAFMVTAPPAVTLAEPDQVRLEAETVGVSCERIKELFLLELGVKDEWRGKIELVVNAALASDREPILTGTYRPDGWSYQLELPKVAAEEVFVRAVVQSLLQEMINRKAGSRSTEVPFWLADGMSAHLRAFNLPTFVIRPNVQTPGALDVRVKGLADVRSGLRGQLPLSFQELSWPKRSDASGADETVYRSCALLLYDDLLRLNDGPACFQKFFLEMPKHLNWQTAFLQAFHAHFGRLLDVEKWWALKSVAFTESDLTEARTEKECWQKLQDALDVPVEVRLAATHLPAEARLTLQEVITQWSPADAAPALQRTIRDLETLQMFAFRYEMTADASAPPASVQAGVRNAEAKQTRIGRELSPLVLRYLTTLVSYQKQSRSVGRYGNYTLFKKDTVRQLNALDKEREVLRVKLLSTARASELNPSASSH